MMPRCTHFVPLFQLVPFVCILVVFVPMFAPTSQLFVSGASLSTVSVSSPTSIFSSTSHPLPRSRFYSQAYGEAHRALPTNRWWQELVLSDGDEPIVTYPYSIRSASPSSSLHRESMDEQRTKAPVGSKLNLAQVGLYASLPVKESSDLQVIMAWKPDLMLTTPLLAPVSASVSDDVDRVVLKSQSQASSSVDSSLHVEAQPVRGRRLLSSESKHKKQTSSSSSNSDAASSSSPSLGAAATLPSPTETMFEDHEVVTDDLLSVRVRFQRKNDPRAQMLFPLVRGSPYITGIYSGGLTPALYTQHAILSVNEEQVPTVESGATNTCTEHSSSNSNRHSLTLNSGHTVLVYLDRKACVQWDRNRILFFQREEEARSNEGDWIVRVAMLPSLSVEVLRNSISILDSFHSNVALSGRVTFDQDSHEAQHPLSVMNMAWRSVDTNTNTLTIDTSSPSSNLIIQARKNLLSSSSSPSDLLLLTLPHHRSSLMNTNEVALQYDSIKGALHGQTGNEWRIRLHHLSSKTTDSSSASPWKSIPQWNAFTTPLSAVGVDKVDAIRTQLKIDAKQPINPEAKDAYSFGKEVSRLARLALIADELHEQEIASNLRATLMHGLQPWFDSSNVDPLYYDDTYGGLCPKRGLHDQNADFGAGYYNDHHFHYGYLLYACAAVAKDSSSSVRSWVDKNRDTILNYVRDIANPSALVADARAAASGESLFLSAGSDSKGLQEPLVAPIANLGDDNDGYYTSLRHIDLFEGHSWANGLLSSPLGRNSESSSEALNAYYSIALLGSALQDENLQYLGEILSAIELHGIHTYWHMTQAKSVYPPNFSANKCVGMIWSSKAVQETFFAVGLPYVHGINLLPITPMSELLLSHAWVEEEYPVLEQSIPHANPPIDDVWLGFAYSDLAVLDRESAWAKLKELKRFDGGASLTNFLWWAATRPAHKQ